MITETFPKMQISECDIKNWDIYQRNLTKYKNINEYFARYINYWINELKDPLEIDIIRFLLIDDLKDIDEKFQSITMILGVDNIKECIEELIGIKDPTEISKKINSINYELQVAKELLYESSNIKKMREIGDWQTDDKIVSVKSILPLDFNYNIIRNYILSLIHIKEYSIIRKYSNIHISEGKKIKDKFRIQYMKFIRDNLINIIGVYDKNIKNIPLTDTYKSHDLIITACCYIYNEIKYIEINISSINKDSNIKIIFRESTYNIFSAGYDYNSYFLEADNINYDYLKKTIIDDIKKINKGFKSIMRDKNKAFEGWIVLPIHPKDEIFAKIGVNKIVDDLKSDANIYDYKKYIFIIPQIGFDLKNKFIIEIK